jgi:SET domain
MIWFGNEIDWNVSKMIEIINQSLKIAGSVKELESLFNKTSKTVFDFDLTNLPTDELKKKLLKCVISLDGSRSEKVETKLFKILFEAAYNKQQVEFLEKFATQMMKVCNTNQFSLKVFDKKRNELVKLGSCLLPFASRMNHSCDPNVIWFASGDKFVFIVAKPIKAGEQLFVSYL